MKHDDLQTPRSIKNLAGLEDRIARALENKFIRNVDYQTLKQRISNALDSERDAVPDRIGRPGPDDGDWREGFYEVVYLIPYQLSHIRTIPKRLPQVVARLGEAAKHPKIAVAVDAVSRMYERWEPILAAMETLKPFIIKGRTPREVPADARTLDNTGTCSCCNRNIKLKDLKIVDHGYQLMEGRVGQCPGVGHYALEVSSEGVEHLQDIFKKRLEKRNKYLNLLEADKVEEIPYQLGRKLEMVGRDDSRFASVRNEKLRLTQQEIQMLEREINRLGEVVDNWKPRLLPDGASHFGMMDTRKDGYQPAP